MTTSIQEPLPHALPATKSWTRRSRAQKLSLVEQFHTSGLTKTAFCKQHGIATSCLSRWQKTLAAESSADAFVDITAPIKAAAARCQEHQSQTQPHWQVELELGDGVVLRVRAG